MSKGVTLPQSVDAFPALYPWNASALARALMFRVEADAIRGEPAMAAFAAYYSLFHLTVFLILQDTRRIDDKLCTDITRAIQGGAVDPSRTIGHRAVQEFAREHALPASYVEALGNAKALREFLNYGPRVTWQPTAERPFFNSCQHSAMDVDALVGGLTTRFREGVRWLHDSGATTLLPTVISEADRYFDPREKFFAALCTSATLRNARTFARDLFPGDLGSDDH